MGSQTFLMSNFPPESSLKPSDLSSELQLDASFPSIVLPLLPLPRMPCIDHLPSLRALFHESQKYNTNKWG